MNEENTSSEDEMEKTGTWLNEHGLPDFEYLQSLAEDGSPEALENLKSIAEDLDVEYDSDTSAEELIGRIRTATDQNEDDENPRVTN
jgi:hypothetical protein